MTTTKRQVPKRAKPPRSAPDKGMLGIVLDAVEKKFGKQRVKSQRVENVLKLAITVQSEEACKDVRDKVCIIVSDLGATAVTVGPAEFGLPSKGAPARCHIRCKLRFSVDTPL